MRGAARASEPSPSLPPVPDSGHLPASSPFPSTSASSSPESGASPGPLLKDDGPSVLYYFCHRMARLFAVLYFRARFEKVERVPQTGPVILAANHQSLFDPCLVGISFKRRACFLARETLFRVPVLGWLIRKLGAFPVPRESAAPRRALEVCVRVLELGRALVLFPEGTRTRDGRMQPLRRGVAQLAQRTGAPVVPVIIQGAHAAWPRERRLPRPGRIRITFGEPLRYHSEGQPKETYDSFMERLGSAYLALAREAGAGEVLPLPFVAGGGPASSAEPSPTNDEGRGSGPQARVASRAEAAESPPGTTAQPSI